jgi:hypothetical protein
MIKNTKKDWDIVRKRIVNKLLELPEGRFPSKRINSLDDVIVFNQEKMHSLSNEAHFNCNSCG